MDAESWEERYRSAARDARRVWSGQPNESVVRCAPEPTRRGDEAPNALDLGCGEGADALWLAAQGWQVTGVDWSEVAVEMARDAARAAAEAGLIGEPADSGAPAHRAGGARFIRGDITDASLLAGLSATGTFDLVTVAFMHPEPDERPAVFAHLPGLVAPGGHLLIVAHDPEHGLLGLAGPPAHRLMSPDDIAAAVDLPAGFEVLISEVRPRTQQDEVVALDSVLLLRRLN